MRSPIKRFTDGKVVAKMWWCEDSVCDCHQPQVFFQGTAHDPVKHFPTVMLWEGTFRSQPSEAEMQEMRAELASAAEHSGVPLDDDGTWGVRPATATEIRDNEHRHNSLW